MTGAMKNFIDRWSQTLRDPNYPDFKVSMSSKKHMLLQLVEMSLI